MKVKNVLPVISIAIGAFLLLACGNGDPIQPTIEDPVIMSFAVAASTLTEGDSTTLTATFSGGDGSINIGVGKVLSGVPIKTPTLSGDTTFLLTVTGAFKTVSKSILVHVVPPPSIVSFSPAPELIAISQRSEVTPIFSNGVATVDQGIGTVESGVAFPVSPNLTTTYTLMVTNPAGKAVSAKATITVSSPKFSTTQPMKGGRCDHTATLLKNGSVLIVGGLRNAGTPFAELYNPDTGQYSTVDYPGDDRFLHTSTLLSDGKVLVAGGWGSSQDAYLSSALLYDPDTNNFVQTGAMKASRGGQTETLLPNGSVLIAGGTNDKTGATALSSLELYEPSNGRFRSLSGSLTDARIGHTATLLKSGKVLITGNAVFPVTVSAELFDPDLEKITTTYSNLREGRRGHTATRLADGKVLLAGGGNGNGAVILPMELFDPSLGTCEEIGNLNIVRSGHTATLLPNGKVLLVGGYSDSLSAYLSSVELFDPTFMKILMFPSLQLRVGRGAHTTTLLLNDHVLVAGGSTQDNVTAESEIF